MKTEVVGKIQKKKFVEKERAGKEKRSFGKEKDRAGRCKNEKWGREMF
jgi:hypothetical protein